MKQNSKNTKKLKMKLKMKIIIMEVIQHSSLMNNKTLLANNVERIRCSVLRGLVIKSKLNRHVIVRFRMYVLQIKKKEAKNKVE